VDQIEAANNPDDLEINIEADISFHEALASATHSGLIIAMMMGLQGALRTWITAQTEQDRGRTLEAVRDHRVIYNAIADRDSELARAAMRRHIANARTIFRQ
jgi:DNA-binding FadR family transcriptional regulator